MVNDGRFSILDTRYWILNSRYFCLSANILVSGPTGEYDLEQAAGGA
jgi:hypothetical protein